MKKSKDTFDLLSILLYSVVILLTIGCNKELKEHQPTLFEPGNISTASIEYGLTFSSSGSEIYFSKSNDQWGKGDVVSFIYYSVYKNGTWSTPKLASFSGKYDDSAPYITNHGKTLYFISKRPAEGGEEVSMDIWKVERDDKGEWGVPMRLEEPINSLANEYCLRTDTYGNLYFASDRKGGYGQGDLYTAKKTNDQYDPPINLGSSLNSEFGEWNLEVNQKGDLIIFEASQRKENLSSYGDLYISFKENDQWSLPQNIKEINTTGSDLYPELIEDTNTLYYSSSDSLESTQTNIYFVDFKNLYTKYRKNAVFPE